MKYRKLPRTNDEIRSYLATMRAVGRREMTHIHMHPADFEQVERSPARFDCTRQLDGRIVTVFNRKLVEVCAVHD